MAVLRTKTEDAASLRERVVRYLDAYGEVTITAVADGLNVSYWRARRALLRLVSEKKASRSAWNHDGKPWGGVYGPYRSRAKKRGR